MLKGYTTRQAIENYLLIDIDPTFYAQIDSWIEAMESYVDKMTGRDFGVSASPTIKLFDGNNSHTLPIDDASEITMVELSSDFSDFTEVLAEDYLKYPTNGQIFRSLYLPDGIFPAGKQNIRVTAKWGAAAAPADISFAVSVLVAGIINYAYDSDGEVQSMSVGPYSVTYKTSEQEADFAKVQEILKLNKRFYF